ncbi:MAG: cysteine desulfurase family protein [Pirellulales bacterium]
MRSIYLDYNATTPIAPRVQEAMLPFLSAEYGNPSSTHRLGLAAHAAIEDARFRVAQLLRADADEIVFTSGGTESNNLAICGLAFARMFGGSSRPGPSRPGPSRPGPSRGHLVISAIEHPAVAEPARFLKRMGFDVSVVAADGDGVVDVAAIERAIRGDTFLVSVMHANNEVGVLQPIARIAEICRARGVPLHSDAAQSVGKIATAVDELGVDLLTVAGHKVYAPKGVGALYVRRGIQLEPVLHGAGHEGGLRPGTENVPYIVGLGEAARLAGESLAAGAGERIATLRDRLHARLQDAIGQPLPINGGRAARLPNTLSVNFPRVAGADLLKRADNVCASTGSACHAGEAHFSPTLSAMGVAKEAGGGCVRLSLGWYTSEEDVDAAADALAEAWRALNT